MSPPTDKQGDLERNVLQAYAPNGMGDTPPTFFDRSPPPAPTEENFDEVSVSLAVVRDMFITMHLI